MTRPATPRTGLLAPPAAWPALMAVTVLAGCQLPAMLPHPWWVQGLVSGLLAAQCYAVAVIVSATTRAVRPGSGRTPGAPAPEARPGLGRAVPMLAVAVTGVAVAVNWIGQRGLDLAVGQAPVSPLNALLSIDTGLIVAAVLVLLGRSARIAARRLWTARRPVTSATVAGLVLLAGSASPPAAAAEVSTNRSGLGTGDPMADAGPRGRELLAQTPTAAELASGGPAGAGRAGAGRASAGRASAGQASPGGHPAMTPVRVYIGLQAAADPADRAQLAVRELDRAGAFRRAAVLVAIPTGSGWVNPAAITTLEQVYAGDVATAAVQYSAVPSWVEYLRGSDQVRTNARTLLDAVRQRALDEPAGHRPRVLVYGESLGVIGGIAALRGADGRASADGALWVGPPATVKDQADAAQPGGRQLAVFHRDDPIPVWSPDLLWRHTDGWDHPWLPVVSFWTALADMISVYGVPVGHGHRYGAELRDAWLRVAPPPSS